MPDPTLAAAFRSDASDAALGWHPYAAPEEAALARGPKTLAPWPSHAAAFDAAEEILFYDHSVWDAHLLIGDLARPVNVVWLHNRAHPLTQIADVLRRGKAPTALHILAHGAPGAIDLAGHRIDAQALKGRLDLLGDIGMALGPKGEIALWACNVAAGDDGAAFVHFLEAATGVRVFASDHVIGAASAGGDWSIGRPSPFAPEAEAAYPSTLD